MSLPRPVPINLQAAEADGERSRVPQHAGWSHPSNGVCSTYVNKRLCWSQWSVGDNQAKDVYSMHCKKSHPFFFRMPNVPESYYQFIMEKQPPGSKKNWAISHLVLWDLNEMPEMRL